MAGKSTIHDILAQHERELVSEWLAELRTAGLTRDPDLGESCTQFVRLLRDATRAGEVTNIQAPVFRPLLDLLEDTSRNRTRQGYSPRETATVIFSFKRPLFSRLRARFENDPRSLAEETWAANELVDSLGLHTTDTAARAREEVIARQQEEMLELSTPVVKLWDGVLALPIIGTLDSARTQVVMETLLSRITETGSTVAIIDITGVPTVDTLTAQHLIKTVTAARLMGAECIISGIRPQIAQTIVHLGVDLGDVTTKATLADAFTVALRRAGITITRAVAKTELARRSAEG